MEQRNATTYGVVAKTDLLDRLEVEVGDAMQPDFRPQMKVMRWDNEVNFSIRAQEHPAATVAFDGRVVKYITPDYEVHQFEKPDASDEGGFEFEWVLQSKPLLNVLTATVQTKGLVFGYQPALTQAEIDAGMSRPENVVGSYAVFHTTKGVMNRSDGKSYRSGKCCHIYRPQAIDALGAKVWCDLNIDTTLGLLTVTVPRAFLNTAMYPVRVDPTFGYTGTGASGQTIRGTFCGGRSSISEDGTGTSISVYLIVSGNHLAKCNVYGDDTGEADTNVPALANGQTEEKTVGTGNNATFVTFNYSVAPSFTSGTFYRLFAWANTDGTTCQVRFDTTGGNNIFLRTLTYGAWPDPSGTLTRFASYRQSIYSTYTAAGGAATYPGADGCGVF